MPGETVIWYQQQVEVVGARGRLWVSLNQGWQLWRDGAFESGPTAWPQNDGEAQGALFAGLRDALHAGGDAWRGFPTAMAAAARRADVMFACYASAARGARVAIGEEWPDSVVSAIER